jgi:hypothetical protein
VIEVDAAAHDLALGLHALCRIGDDASAIDGVIEDGRQDAEGALDGRGGPVDTERSDPVLDRRAADVADPYVTPARCRRLLAVRPRRTLSCRLGAKLVKGDVDDHVFLTTDELTPADLGEDVADVDAVTFRGVFGVTQEA